MSDQTQYNGCLQRCKNGDNKAYKELYQVHARAMLNVSYRIVNDRNEAEDILQECFLKAFQCIKQFETEQNFVAWLKRVVVNRSIDFIRKNKMQVIPIDWIDPPEELPEPEDTAYDLETVKRGMGLLPDGYRVVLSLYLLEGYGHKEIAEMLHISEGTSKSQYKRAKEKLIQLIKQQTVNHEQSA